VILAGGTDFMVRNRRGAGLPVSADKPVLLIGHLSELKEIFYDDNKIEIGAAASYSRILDAENIPEILRTAIMEIASPAIRNVGTIGGNICNASPAGDTLPPLYVLDGRVRLASENSVRQLPLEEFITGPGKTNLKEEELLVSVSIEVPVFTRSVFKKIGTRKANALAKASFCGMASVEGGKIEFIRMSFGAVAPTVIRRREIEKELSGLSRAEMAERIEEVLEKYAFHINPIDDQRSTAVYRKGIMLNLVRKFLLEDIWE
jgi:CO/xanthine dehydrogenase FAD-binding subunit